jgi:hypothetical protein
LFEIIEIIHIIELYIFKCIAVYKLKKNENTLFIGIDINAVTFNYRIVDGYIEFPYCMQLYDKSDNLMNNPPSLNLQQRDKTLI